MKSYEFWCTKKCPGKQFISKFIYEVMENYEFISEFMKKKYDFGCSKKCSIKEFLYMNSYMNTIFMNLYTNSHMNQYMRILKI